MVTAIILLFSTQTLRNSMNNDNLSKKELKLVSKKLIELAKLNIQKLINCLISVLKRIRLQAITSIAALLIAITSLLVAYNQYKSSIQLQELQNKLYQTELNIVEGQLVASLLTNLIRGNEAERTMALLILKLKAPNMAEIVLPVISEKDPDRQVRQFAKQEYKNLKLTNSLKDARILLELKRYHTSAKYFYDAIQFIDKSKLNKLLLDVAISRYHANSDSLAAALFQEVFKDYK
jgi:hypothetical protein